MKIHSADPAVRASEGKRSGKWQAALRVALVCSASFLVSLYASSALASTWVYADTDINNSVHYYDADSITRSGDLVTFWMKVDHSKDKTTKARETKFKKIFDCRMNTDTLLYSIQYYPNGKTDPISIPTYAQEPTPVVPDSVGETMFNEVCSSQ